MASAEAGSVIAIRVLLGQPVNSVPQVPSDPSAKVSYLSLPCPILSCPVSFGLCVNLSFSPACRCTQHGRCDEGLGGSGSCFCDEGWTGPRCEVQLGEWPWACAACVYALTVCVCTRPGCALRWRPRGRRGVAAAARNAASDLIVWGGSWDRVAACVHPSLCTPGRVPFGQQL